jgi:LacI family transcriptional regulator
MSARPSIRSLAAALGLSPATVSEALRSSPRVAKVTRDRVERAAAKAGYRPNRLIGQVMAEIRRTTNHAFHGTIAMLITTEPPNLRRVRFHEEILKGARRRAEELGYSVEIFRVGDGGLPLRRLATVLRTRGISGLVVMPFETAQDWEDFAWEHVTFLRALHRLRDLGYRRVGLCLREMLDVRIHRKWSGAFIAYQQELAAGDRVPVHRYDALTAPEFLSWFGEHRPEVVVSHDWRIVSWLRESGHAVPGDTGFFNLNCIEEPALTTGFDLVPDLLGAAAIESVVAQLYRNERGVPAHPKTIMIEGRWNPGPTLRETAAPAATAGITGSR